MYSIYTSPSQLKLMDGQVIFSISNPLRILDLCETVGSEYQLTGPKDTLISSVASLHSGDQSSLVFCRKVGVRAQEEIKNSISGTIVCKQKVSNVPNKTLIVVDDPRGWFIDALNILNPIILSADNGSSSPVSPDAKIGRGVKIGPGSVVEAGAIIGDDCTIGAFCYLGSAAILEPSVVLQSHTSVGNPGLSFHERPNGDHIFFQHMGHAIIGTKTVVGAYSSIVRGVLENTTIGKECEIGNYVNIGHNCEVGNGVFISSSSVLTGGVRLGAHSRVAAGCKITAHCKVGKNSRIGLGSVVVRDIGDGEKVFGNPARPLPTMREF